MIDAVTLLDTGEAHLFPTADALKDAIDVRSRFLAKVWGAVVVVMMLATCLFASCFLLLSRLKG